MTYLLDTNICIYTIRQKPRSVLDKIITLQPTDIGISSITIAELYYGVNKSIYPEKNKLALTHFLSPFEIFDFDVTAGMTYGKIRSDLEKRGELIGGMDMLIAAQALSLGLTLVTNNEREFKRIRGLSVVNWVK